MYIIAFFTSNGSPATGLSPTIRIRDVSDSSLVVTDAAMSEVGDGWYKYDFTAYDSTKDYAIRCDGTASLPATERYVYAGSELSGIDDIKGAGFVKGTHSLTNLGADITLIKQVEQGRWRIVSNQMIFYDSDGSTPLLTFDLKDSDGEPAMEGVYERVPA